MKKVILVFLTLLVLITLIPAMRYYIKGAGNNKILKKPERIISLSPSITETLYFFGEWNHLIALTRYCVYPSEVSEKPKIGGVQDINYEAVVALKPDLVIMTVMQKEAEEKLTGFGIPILVLNHNTMEGVIESFKLVGERLDNMEKADELIKNFTDSITYTKNKISGKGRKTAVFSLFRSGSEINTVAVAGNDGYYSKIFDYLGVSNPFGKYSAYPSVSKEGLINVDPDVIIELNYNPEMEASAMKDWFKLSQLKAVRDNNICIISDSYGYVPGPRFPLLIDKMARCIYPEAYLEGK